MKEHSSKSISYCQCLLLLWTYRHLKELYTFAGIKHVQGFGSFGKRVHVYHQYCTWNQINVWKNFSRWGCLAMGKPLSSTHCVCMCVCDGIKLYLWFIDSIIIEIEQIKSMSRADWSENSPNGWKKSDRKDTRKEIMGVLGRIWA